MKFEGREQCHKQKAGEREGKRDGDGKPERAQMRELR